MTKIETPVRQELRNGLPTIVDANGHIVPDADMIAALNRTAELDKWRLAVESLTPQGSEFHNDLDACLAYIHKRQMDEHERYKAKHRECAELEAENARLKAEVAAANKGAKTNALVNKSLADKLKLAVEALSDARSNLFAIYNGDWPFDISPTPAGFAQFAVNDIDRTLAKQIGEQL